LYDLSAIFAHAKAHNAISVAAADLLALTLYTPPGEMGADIVVGEGQSIGNALNFGGPYVGLFATKSQYVRQMPGRLCGQTVDAEGTRGFVLTLSTREQHIRRDKATSNICTNSGLCSLAFTIHMSLLGQTGLQRVAEINHANAVKLADDLSAINGVEVLNDTFFNEFTVRLPGNALHIVEQLVDRGVMAGVPVCRLLPDAGLDDLLLVANTEVNTDEDRAALVAALKEVV
jgi:glycine dehydrogenase subunit 1